MKNIVLGFLFVLLCLGCQSDENPVTPDSDEEQGEQQDDTPQEEEEPTDSSLTFSLVNAFQNLSFDSPVDLQTAPQEFNQLYVVEQPGVIRVFQNTSTANEALVFLDLRNQITTTQTEQGLLGLAFHPNFAVNGLFYVYYTPRIDLAVVSQFQILDNTTNPVADLDSQLVLLEIPQPFSNHNSGQLAFGPDGMLYISSGDGGSGGDPQNNAQNRSNVLGTILRIDVDQNDPGLNYAIPPDNPFAGEPNVREEIYAYGLRNPWRMSFDTATGVLWSGDVGQNEREEINQIVSGGNYGWRLFEGNLCFSGDCDPSGLIAPILDYDQTNGDRAVVGGHVYRGNLTPELNGMYVYGDYVSGRIWALDAATGSDNELLIDTSIRISSFGTDAQNELFICGADGNIYQLQAN